MTNHIGWLGRPMRRFPIMNNIVRISIAAAAVIGVAILGYGLLRGPSSVGPSATPTLTPIATPTASELRLPGADYTQTPFGIRGFGMCPSRTLRDCTEDPRDDSITVTVHAAEGWEGSAPSGVFVAGNLPPDGAAMIIHRGGWLYSQPCRGEDYRTPDISVGPTVDDWATALDSHPLLQVTTPVEATLAGYSGKYVELQVPSDIGMCLFYRPLDDTSYAQGARQRWRFWILDVEGIRVVIQTTHYPSTPAESQTELQAIVDSIQIQL
jgi:hypothetical protein